MKKFLLLLLLISLCFAGWDYYSKNSARENAEADYEKITEVETALREVLPQYVQANFNADERKEYWLTEEFMTENPDDKFVQLVNDKFGEDYKYTLTNGDHIVIHACNYNIGFQLFVDSPGNVREMIYPDWNYSKLEEPGDDLS